MGDYFNPNSDEAIEKLLGEDLDLRKIFHEAIQKYFNIEGVVCDSPAASRYWCIALSVPKLCPSLLLFIFFNHEIGVKLEDGS